MTIILDLMTSKVISISSIFIVVGIILYLPMKFFDIKHPRIVSAITRIGMDSMIIGVSLIAMYSFVYMIIG